MKINNKAKHIVAVLDGHGQQLKLNIQYICNMFSVPHSESCKLKMYIIEKL